MNIPAQIRRVGQETKLPVQGRGEAPDLELDRNLLRLLGQAHRFGKLEMAGQGKSIAELTREAGMSGRRIRAALRGSALCSGSVMLHSDPARRSRTTEMGIGDFRADADTDAAPK